MNVTININVNNLNAQLDIFDVQFDLLVKKGSVVRMSKESMGQIIDKTAGPAPAPKVIYYQRTGRWLGGWANAANLIGVPLTPTAETPRIVRNGGHAYIYEDDNEYSFKAVNSTTYAAAIEESGTWRSPFPERRPAYRYVIDAIESPEAEERFKEIIKEQWDKIIYGNHS